MIGKSTFLKILSGELQLESGTMRLGDTVKIGYYEQQGLILTPEQEKQPVLKFVQEECERASSSDKSFSSGENAPQIAVTIAPASSMGRRDRLAGKVGLSAVLVNGMLPFYISAYFVGSERLSRDRKYNSNISSVQ